MSEFKPVPGTLYIVATPIGNLGDITLRALETLGGVDWIAAEDTRRTRKLIERYKISTRLISFHGDSEKRKTPELLERLAGGESGAVVTDAGTPGASDPGGGLVAAAVARGLVVSPIPGPSAIAAAVSAAGLDSSRFVFEGFLPRAGAKRKQIIELLATEERSVIFFESANRIKSTLTELYEAWGDRRLAVFRELTKLNEEILHTSLRAAAEGRIQLKEIGEYTIIAGGAARRCRDEEEGAAELERFVSALTEAGVTPGVTARAAAGFFGVSRNAAYRAVKAAPDAGGGPEEE